MTGGSYLLSRPHRARPIGGLGGAEGARAGAHGAVPDFSD